MSSFHDTLLDRSLIVSRLAGLITSGPSMLLTLIVFNSLLFRYDGRFLQRAVLLSCILSFINDVLILFTMSKWLVDHDETYWPICILVINALKRIHSVTTVHLVFLRTTALFRQLIPYKKWVNVLTLSYALLGLVSLCLHVYSYYLGGWNTNVKRTSAVFRFGYRSTNLLCVLLYSLPAIATDIVFFTRNRITSTMRQRLDSIKIFFDPVFYCILEVAMVFAVSVPLVATFFNKTIDWTSPTYTEQLLLATVALNSVFSVKAATLLPGETDVESCDQGLGASTSTTNDAFVVSNGRVHRPAAASGRVHRSSRAFHLVDSATNTGSMDASRVAGAATLTQIPGGSGRAPRSDVHMVKLGFPLPQLLLSGFDRHDVLRAGEPLYIYPASPRSSFDDSQRPSDSGSDSNTIITGSSLLDRPGPQGLACHHQS